MHPLRPPFPMDKKRPVLLNTRDRQHYPMPSQSNICSPISRQPCLQRNLRSIARSNIRRNTTQIHRNNLGIISARGEIITLRQRKIGTSLNELGEINGDVRRAELAAQPLASSLGIGKILLRDNAAREETRVQKRRQPHLALLVEGLTKMGERGEDVR